MDRTQSAPRARMSDAEFAMLGGGEVGYIREMPGEKAAEMFGIRSEIVAGRTVYTLHAADGTCMAIGDSRAAVFADALEKDLHPVSVH